MHDRPESMRRLMAARAAPLRALFSSGFGNPMLMDAEKLCGLFLPEAVPEAFEDLAIPLTVSTADLFARAEQRFSAGPLRAPLAASMAIPGLLRPVEIDGRVLVDGAAVNPLPFDHVRGRADLIVAVDTATGPAEPRGIPDPWDALFSTIQLMGQAIVSEKLRHGAPDLVIRPEVSTFRLLDFFRVSAILRVADRAKADAKTALAQLLGLSL
jgi:NTE family protein